MKDVHDWDEGDLEFTCNVKVGQSLPRSARG